MASDLPKVQDKYQQQANIPIVCDCEHRAGGVSSCRSRELDAGSGNTAGGTGCYCCARDWHGLAAIAKLNDAL